MKLNVFNLCTLSVLRVCLADQVERVCIVACNSSLTSEISCGDFFYFVLGKIQGGRGFDEGKDISFGLPVETEIGHALVLLEEFLDFARRECKKSELRLFLYRVSI